MNYQLEKAEGKVKFTFSVSPEEWEAEINNVFNKSKSRFNVPGFRKGHAPRKMVENFYGQGVFFDDAINNCIKNGYTKALDENPDIYPVDEPQADIAKFNDKEKVFTLEVTVKPEVKLGAYTGINLDKVEYTVKQDDVKAAIERDKKAHVRKLEIKDRAVQNGDKLNIDYSGSVDGVKFEGGTAEKQELTIGSKMFIPGFEEQLIGMNIGETKDISVKFPEDYHAKNLAGKDAIFTVTVNSGVVEEIPQENDDFAQEMGPYETFAEYKKDVEKKLKEDNKRKADLADENNIIEAVVKNAEFTVPDCMVETQLNYELDDLRYRLSASGLKLEDYFKYIGSSEKDFKEERKNDALTTVRTRLVIEALVKQLVDDKKIEVTDKEVDDKLEEYAKGGKITAEQLKKSGQENYFRNDLLMTKAIAFLKENNTFTKKTKAKKSEVKEDVANGLIEVGFESAEKPTKKSCKKSTKKATE